MGVLPPISTCSTCPPTPVRPAGNPDPGRYVLEHVVPVGRHVVAQIRYPDATNYEGVKVLVYRNTTASQVRRASRLDPHFCDDGHLAPFARFEPADAGRRAAVALARQLDDVVA